MNPGRLNHEPSELVFYRSHGPDRRTRVSQGCQTCAGIMNPADRIMNPLGWSFVRRPQWLGGYPVMTGFVRGSSAIRRLLA